VLLALIGGDIIDIEINGIKGNRFTEGHRFLSSGMIELRRAEDYFDVLEEAYCIVDQDKRKAIIEKGICKLAEEAGGEIAEDERLLTELTYLAEHPAPLAGRLDSDLLSLPKEVHCHVYEGASTVLSYSRQRRGLASGVCCGA